MDYNIGDIVRTKKQHPCGSKLWEITRVGVDFKLKCQGCGHVVVLERPKALKAITKIEEGSTTHTDLHDDPRRHMPALVCLLPFGVSK